MLPLIQDYSTEQTFSYSIILPLSNDLEYFEAWLESLLTQTYQDSTEILLIDNHNVTYGRQALEVILRKYSAYLQRKAYTFHYVRHPQHLRSYDSLNVALQLSNGRWLNIAREQDLLLPNAFFEVEKIISDNPNLDLISSQFYRINDQSEITEKSPKLATQGLVEQQFRYLFLLNNPLSASAIFYNKAIFTKVGYFNGQVSEDGEWELLRRLTQAPAINWYYLPKYLACSRLISAQVKDNQATNLHDKKSMWKILKLGETYYSHREQRLAKKSQYIKIFSLVNQLFLDKKVDETFALLLEIVQYSELGDRLWLEVLNQSTLKYKREIYDVIVMFSRQAIPC